MTYQFTTNRLNYQFVLIMKPYAGELPKGSPKRVFNYRLSRARRTVEYAFGLFVSVYRIFRKPLTVKPSTAEDITPAVYIYTVT
jgi:hypothetical protein